MRWTPSRYSHGSISLFYDWEGLSRLNFESCFKTSVPWLEASFCLVTQAHICLGTVGIDGGFVLMTLTFSDWLVDF